MRRLNPQPVPVAAKATVAIEIEGVDLPGRRCGPRPEGDWYENIHVGLARRTDTIGLVPGDAATARWTLDVSVRRAGDGTLDVSGAFVSGKRGERSLGLRWGTLDADGTFTVFRAAKLRISDVPATLLEQASTAGGRLIGRLGLTDVQGHPICASVRPPDIIWSISSSGDSHSERGG